MTVLPASPDKAAALLLLARNACVGVSSLLTTLLSHGLSCRRRAKCHHIREMLEAFFPGARRVQGMTLSTSQASERNLDRDQAVRGGRWCRAGAGGALLRGAAIPYGWLPSRCYVCGRLYIRFVDMAFANHLPMESTGNKTKEPFQAGLACFSEPVEPSCPHWDGQWD